MATSFQTISRKGRNGERLRGSVKWGDGIHRHLMTNNRNMHTCVLDEIPAGFWKVIGVTKTPSGCWRTTIFNPSTELSECIGTYDTPEEAADAYINKKLEFEAVLHGREIGKKKTGVWYSPTTGKWGAAIRNPVTRVLVWLGTYDTIHEAQTASKRKTQISGKKLDLMVSDHQTSVFKKPVGIALNESGTWRAIIMHPVTKVLLHLGTYSTPKEAEEARKKKELEFEHMFPDQRMKMGSAKPSWYAVVEDPVTRCSNYIYLGLFGSADEAEEALMRKKRELDSLASGDHLVANEVHVAMENEYVQKPILFQENEVVNAYGELVGEFSRIDDELRLV